MDKAIDLNRHYPSVESVVSRLSRHEEKIKHISAIVEWEDGNSDIYHDTKDVAKLCYESVAMNKYVGDFILNTQEDG